MRARSWGIGFVLGAIALAGCGSSHKSTTTAATAASASSATAPPGATPPPGAPPASVPSNAPPAIRAVAGRVLVAGDIPRLSPQGPRTLGISAGTWVEEEQLPPSERAKEARRLEALSFVRGVRERLAAAGETGSEGLSIVIQFRSPRSAVANVAYEASPARAQGSKPFTVAGIPGAKGFGGASGATTGYNVAFAKGDYYYLVGVGYTTGAPGAPTREQLVAAAHKLYARVR